MIKTFSKIFSILLILVLVQSNFSFAITQMLCKMGKTKNVCECDHSCTNELKISSEESSCCKVSTEEINNTNILEINKLSVIKVIKFQLSNDFLPVKLISNISQSFSSHIIHFKPPADIPILFSNILI